MKALCSISAMVATMALLALSVPVPAFPEMKDMSMQEHKGGHGQHGQHAQHGQRMEMCNLNKMDDMMGMCCEHAGKLGLSDEQTMKMKPIHSEMQKKQARFQADLKIAQIELRDIMDVKDFDLEKASAAAKKIEEIKTAHHLEMLTAMKEMRSILTEEQFKNMKKMMPMEKGKKRPAKRMMKKNNDK